MTKEAVVRGAARWIEKNVVPNLAPRGALRVMLKGALALAKASPDFAVGVLSTKFPVIQTLVPLAGNDEALAAMVEAMKTAAKEEGGMVVQFYEVGLWNNTPHSLVVTPELMDDLYAEMKSASAAERSGTAA